jgi:hypothetical protein
MQTQGFVSRVIVSAESKPAELVLCYVIGETATR